MKGNSCFRPRNFSFTGGGAGKRWARRQRGRECTLVTGDLPQGLTGITRVPRFKALSLLL